MKIIVTTIFVFAVLFGQFSIAASDKASLSYPVVDTNQTGCVSLNSSGNTCPANNQPGFGQDAQYQGLTPSYTDNGDGTVTDNNTHLMWSQTADINGDGRITVADKLSYKEALKYAQKLKLAGHTDWRLPSIKELYSLMLFDGEDPSGLDPSSSTVSITPFIAHEYFGFNSGDVQNGERLIDAQYVSSTLNVSNSVQKYQSVFGVNFIDGRIKAYGLRSPRGYGAKTFYVHVVRGSTSYGLNQFANQYNGTIKDAATGLIWQRKDSEKAMDWPSALAYCESLELAGKTNWRLPNAKELQSIVDYHRAPDVTHSAAISNSFYSTPIKNELGENDFAQYWSSTTHKNLNNNKHAIYIAFGRSLGFMHGSWQDVHGAGAQRSDPKVDEGQDFPEGRGPQGDAIRIFNFARCVSDDTSEFVEIATPSQRTSKTFVLAQRRYY